MKLPGKIRLSRILSKHDSRPFLKGAFVKEEEVEVCDMAPGRPTDAKKMEKHLVAHATNSYCFARIDLGPPEDEKDVGGPIPEVALRHMERGVNVELGAEEIVAGLTHYERVFSDDIDHRGERRCKVGEEVNYPEWDGLYPDHGKNVLSIGINPVLLADLAAALGTGKHEGVILEVDLDKLKEIKPSLEIPAGQVGHKTVLSVIKVQTMGLLRDRAEGLIMPIRVTT